MAKLRRFVLAILPVAALVAAPVALPHGPGSTTNVFVLDLGSGKLRQVTANHGAAEDALAYAPAWSPDGLRLAFAQTSCHYCTSQIRILRVRGVGWPGRKLVSGFSPRWSPDGRRAGWWEPTAGARAPSPRPGRRR